MKHCTVSVAFQVLRIEEWGIARNIRLPWNLRRHYGGTRYFPKPSREAGSAVLPHRFQKVRYYGFFRAQQRPRLQPLQALLAVTPKAEDPTQFSHNQDTAAEPHLTVIRCPQCGGPMQLVDQLPRRKPASSPPPPIRSP